MIVTAAVLEAPTVVRAGEPGIRSGRSRGASRLTVTDRPAGSTATWTWIPGNRDWAPASLR